MSSRLRKPMTEIVVDPSSLCRRNWGNTGATPSPPPTRTAFFRRSRWDSTPSGPMKSMTEEPSGRAIIWWVVFPTACTTTVTVPRPRSKSATVRGMRSPVSSMRTMTKCPGWHAFATSGASTSQRKVTGPNCSRLTILYIGAL